MRRSSGLRTATATVIVLALVGASCAGDDTRGSDGATDTTITPATVPVPEPLPPDSVPPAPAVAELVVDFAQCLRDEGMTLPRLDPGRQSLLDVLRERAQERDEVREAVLTCFPVLAEAYQDAGLRPPTQGELVVPPPAGDEGDGSGEAPADDTGEGQTGLGPTASAGSQPVSGVAKRGSERPGVAWLRGLGDDDRQPGEPVYDGDYADPFVLVDSEDRWVYATNTVLANVPVAELGERTDSLDVTDALPELPSWSEAGFVWAPAAAAVDDGFALYYTTRHRRSGRQCVSVAIADEPTGPFTDESDEPVVCQLDLGGTIDASPVRTDDGLWLLFKSDGNCCGIATNVYVQELEPDGTAVKGEAVPLLVNDRDWELDVIEAPSMLATDDRYLLFYSANRWDTADYAVGYAECETVTGPCAKAEDLPWLASYEDAAGPGGQELVATADGASIVYHGWPRDTVGYDNGAVRRLYFEPLGTDEDEPRLDLGGDG